MEGTLKVIDEVQTFASGFTKREFVVEVEDGKYPQMIKFECLKDKTALTDGFQVGDKLRVHFDIRGNEYNGRFFVNLNAWKLEKQGGGGEASGGDDDAPPAHLTEPPAGHGQDSGASEDDIPF